VRKEILMKKVIFTFVIVGMLYGVSFAAEMLPLKDENDRLNYSLGFQIGDSLRRQGVKVSPDVLLKGIQDALSASEPLMSLEEMKKTLASERQEKRKMAEQYWREGQEFLAKNAKKPGVVTLPSGLQYKVIREGTGKSPGANDSVTVDYRGTLINGQEFDSSYRKGEPATFRVDGVIKGWNEALQLMKEGAKWQLFIPPDLAYGRRGPLENQTLIFDVELISVKSLEK
jgi:FKBP-type peptidyl-prolyl cis-trans isomerase FklB